MKSANVVHCIVLKLQIASLFRVSRTALADLCLVSNLAMAHFLMTRLNSILLRSLISSGPKRKKANH